MREAEQIGNLAEARKFDVSKTGGGEGSFSTKLQSQVGFCGQKAKFPEEEEKRSSYLNDKQQFGYAGSSEMWQLKELQGFNTN